MNAPTETLHDGRYVVARVLGEGAQGETLEAIDQRDGRVVAVKRFRVRGAKAWKDVELAEREARVLATLSHPSLPVYLDHFEENGCLYLAMEKVDGESLAALRARGARLAPAEIRRLLGDVGGALDYLHDRAPPVIHRDVKPGNVIRRPDGSFCLVDFGSVRDTLKPEGGSTVVGTFGYMAPEQFQARALPGSDVYGLGATLLALVTGTEPEKLPHKGLAVDVAGALGRDADPRLVSVLARMLEPDPDRRASRVGPLLDDLDRRTERRPARDQGELRANVRDARRAAHRLRDELRRERRRDRREGWSGRRGRRRGVHPLVLAFVMLGLTAAQLATWALFDVALPLLLTLLSIAFGPRLRDAAQRVRDVGRRGREGLRRANRVVRAVGEESWRGAADDDRVRVAESPPRARVDELQEDEDDDDHVDPPRVERRMRRD